MERDQDMINREKAQFKYKVLRNLSAVCLSLYGADRIIRFLNLGNKGGIIVFEGMKMIVFSSIDYWIICNVHGGKDGNNKFK